jgi:prepilin signal peptidase PulO-like enzyme (type II secretory pathway)
MYAFFAFIFGLLFGSYGNSIVYRLPRKLFEEYNHAAHEELNLPVPAKVVRIAKPRLPGTTTFLWSAGLFSVRGVVTATRRYHPDTSSWNSREQCWGSGHTFVLV